MFDFLKTKKPTKATTATKKGPSTPPPASTPKSIIEILLVGLRPGQNTLAGLKESFQQGMELFKKYNQSRLELAFKSFDPSMKEALFEILFLLHSNEKTLGELTYTPGKRGPHDDPKPKTVSLYLEGAPAGIAGIEHLSDFFKQEFQDYIQSAFNEKVSLRPPTNPAIMSIFSIGSIGTVGHKHLASDLDLEVLYRLEPFFHSPKELDDRFLKIALLTLAKERAAGLRNSMKKSMAGKVDFKNPQVNQKIAKKAQELLAQQFPLLWDLLMNPNSLYRPHLTDPTKVKLKQSLLKEVLKLTEVFFGTSGKKEKAKKEALLKERVNLIQNYIADKFPEAEIYLFCMSEKDLAAGRFASTLESKESSGSAYEKILSYDTLMPGVYFTPGIPTHFLFSNQVNNSNNQYNAMMGFLQLGLLEPIFGEAKTRLVEQGNTPDLSPDYVFAHKKAIYWEAFKASYGNLPKATMNLLRYETLLYAESNKTAIQLIKDPQALDQFIPPTGGFGSAEQYPPGSMQKLEEKFPALLYDPWWLRYKALKICFSANRGRLDPQVQEEILQVLDVTFALHVKLSDVFSIKGKTLETHREQVLADYLDQCFPPGSSKRFRLQAIFVGELNAVKELEVLVRKVFKECVDRVLHMTRRREIDMENREIKIWYHYYQKNFEPSPETIPRTILQHLQVARGQLQVGFEPGQGWFFKSLQKQSSQGKRFAGDGLNLPDEVMLMEKSSFLSGLAFCIANGYYGVLDKGTLKERHTSLAMVASKLDMGNEDDNSFAYVNPGQIENIMLSIDSFFEKKKLDYTSCIKEPESIKEVFVFSNLFFFGQLSFLYRDNFGTLRYAKFKPTKLRQSPKWYNKNILAFFRDEGLMDGLVKFFDRKGINPRQILVTTWVNTNSFATAHGEINLAQKQKDLNRQFLDELYQYPYEKVVKDDISLSACEAHLDHDSLYYLITTATLMTALDGRMKDKDYELHHRFLASNGVAQAEVESFFSRVAEQVERFFTDKPQIERKIDRWVESLDVRLTYMQKKILLLFLAALLRFESKNLQNKQAFYEKVYRQIALPCMNLPDKI